MSVTTSLVHLIARAPVALSVALTSLAVACASEFTVDAEAFNAPDAQGDQSQTGGAGAGASGTGAGGTSTGTGGTGTGGTGGAPGCQDECTDADTQCADGALQICSLGAQGCTEWGPELSCPEPAQCADEGSCSCPFICKEDWNKCADGEQFTCDWGQNGCLDWGAPTLCTDGIGFCADDEWNCGTCDHACEPEETTCADGLLTRCTEDIQGCRIWDNPQQCAAGNGFCKNGAECGECADVCTLGTSVCQSRDLTTCMEDSRGCPKNEVTQCIGYCETPTSCVDCEHACTAGDTQCVSGKLERCMSDQATGCLDWVFSKDCNPAFCAADQKSCGVCPDVCTLGEKECLDGDLRTCVAGAYNCPTWSGYVPCGDYCVNKDTCGQCPTPCAQGSTKCEQGSTQTCVENQNGCWIWSQPVACEEGFCQDPASCGQCVHDCTVGGQTKCENGTSYDCIANTNGCGRWNAVQACNSGYYCSGDQCVACVNDCSVNDTQCSSGKQQTCQQNSQTSCWEWGDPTACGADYYCDASVTACTACQHECADTTVTTCVGDQLTSCKEDARGCRYEDTITCPSGSGCETASTCDDCVHACTETTCSDGTLSTCAPDEEGCRGLTVSSCSEGNGFCAGSACGECPDPECTTPSALRCGASGLEECQEDANGCLAWHLVDECSSGWCADAACQTCQNECAAGTSECTSATEVKHCVETDATHGCYGWDVATPCGDFCDETSNDCASCGVECTDGQVRCVNGKREQCGNDPSDHGCLRWLWVEDCSEPNYCDAGGVECGTCAHECALGDTSCESGTLSSCEADATTTCRSYGAAASCDFGVPCANAFECVDCSTACTVGATECSHGFLGTCQTVTGGCPDLETTQCPELGCADDETCGPLLGDASEYPPDDAHLIRTVDLNQDGDPDLVIAWDDGIASLLGRTSSQTLPIRRTTSFSEGARTTTTGQVVAMETGFFNEDRYPDVAVIVVTQTDIIGIPILRKSYGVAVLHGAGDGSFGKPTSVARDLGSIQHLAVADFDENGISDIAVATSTTVTVALGDGNGGFTRGSETDVDGIVDLTAGHFNQDALADLAIATPTMIYSLLSQDGEPVSELVKAAEGLGMAGCLKARRLDLDELQDLIVCDQEGTLFTFAGQGDGTFRSRGYVTTHGAASIAIAHLNDDGALDLVTHGAGSRQVEVILGNGDGSFEGAAVVTMPIGVVDITAGAYTNGRPSGVAGAGTPSSGSSNGVAIRLNIGGLN